LRASLDRLRLTNPRRCGASRWKVISEVLLYCRALSRIYI
jgi:hypothetical protein